MRSHARVVTQRHLPSLIARVEVNCDDRAVRGLVDGKGGKPARRVVGVPHGHRDVAVGDGVVGVERIRSHPRWRHPKHRRLIGDLEVDDSRCGVEGTAPPTRSANHPRQTDRPHRGRGSEQWPAPERLERIQRRRLDGGGEVDHVVGAEPLLRIRLGAGGKRLGCGRLFAGHIAGGHRVLLDRPDGLARHPIEHEEKAHLGGNRDDVTQRPVDAHGAQHRWRRDVVIPQPVMHGLEIPFHRPGAGVEADDRLSVEAVSFSRSPVVVIARRAHGQVHQPTGDVDAERSPDIGVAGGAPRLVFPCLRGGIGRVLGNRAPTPHPFAGPHVERLNVTRWIVGIDQLIGHPVANDHEIPPHHGRRCFRVVELVDRPSKLRDETHHSGVAKALDQFSGRRIDRQQLPAAVHEDPALTTIRPRGHAAVDEPGAVGRLSGIVGPGVVRPELRATVGVERDDAVVRRAQIERVVDHQRRRLKVPGADASLGHFTRGPLPCGRQPRHRLAIDAGERGVLGGSGIATVNRPAPVLRPKDVRVKHDDCHPERNAKRSRCHPEQIAKRVVEGSPMRDRPPIAWRSALRHSWPPPQPYAVRARRR